VGPRQHDRGGKRLLISNEFNNRRKRRHKRKIKKHNFERKNPDQNSEAGWLRSRKIGNYLEGNQFETTRIEGKRGGHLKRIATVRSFRKSIIPVYPEARANSSQKTRRISSSGKSRAKIISVADENGAFYNHKSTGQSRGGGPNSN